MRLVFMATPLTPRAEPMIPYRKTAIGRMREYGESVMQQARNPIETAMAVRDPMRAISHGA
jgi:hypothetical protein